jgi:uncharacterized protein YjaG (DUF416 family)
MTITGTLNFDFETEEPITEEQFIKFEKKIKAMIDDWEMTGKISAIDTCITILEFEIKNINEREKEADQVSENKNFSMGYIAPRFNP